jgi:DNA repair protein RadA/Sms
VKTRFICQNCGSSFPKWLGKCSDCGTWDSLVEEPVLSAAAAAEPASPSMALNEISLREDSRGASGSGELDRVLGGGIVPGSVILLGGDPGIGKTTLLLDALGRLSRERDVAVLYCTGEESPRQIKLRAERLGLDSPKLFILSRNGIEGILEETVRLGPAVLVIDSIQTMTSSRLESPAGSVGQVRQVAGEIVPFAKKRDLPVFLVGHVTKDGSLAGPRVLEHMVDTVLYFEGENTRDYRILRSVKNRFGSTNEIGIFEMSEGGLKEVVNPSRLFLRADGRDLAGSVVTASLEGTRPFLVEIQSLTAPTGFSVPRRGCSGADPSRFAMLVALLEKKGGLLLQDQDIYLNFTGGLRVVEPAADAGILTAIYSSFKGLPVDHGAVVFGEVGLTGEIRPVVSPEVRIREAAKLGFERCILPRSSLSQLEKKDLGIKLQGVSQVNELFEGVFP